MPNRLRIFTLKTLQYLRNILGQFFQSVGNEFEKKNRLLETNIPSGVLSLEKGTTEVKISARQA